MRTLGGSDRQYASFSWTVTLHVIETLHSCSAGLQGQDLFRPENLPSLPVLQLLYGDGPTDLVHHQVHRRTGNWASVLHFRLASCLFADTQLLYSFLCSLIVALGAFKDMGWTLQHSTEADIRDKDA